MTKDSVSGDGEILSLYYDGLIPRRVGDLAVFRLFFGGVCCRSRTYSVPLMRI